MIKYLTIEEIIEIHDEIIEEFGGSSGILNRSALYFILDQMEIPEDIIHKGIVLMFGIIQNHPFVDGNKRTAIECLYTFLTYNLKEIRKEEKNKAEEVILKIAKNEISRNEVRRWIKSLVVFEDD